jgi:NADPH2 dehydrogenase
VGEGYLVREAAEIQKHVRVPVIGVGGIESGAYIDRKLREGEFGLAAVGRAILKDPKAWFDVNLTVRSAAC